MKTLRCFTVDKDGFIDCRGWKVGEKVSLDPSGTPLSHFVVIDDCDTRKARVVARSQMYFFLNEE